MCIQFNDDLAPEMYGRRQYSLPSLLSPLFDLRAVRSQHRKQQKNSLSRIASFMPMPKYIQEDVLKMKRKNKGTGWEKNGQKEGR